MVPVFEEAAFIQPTNAIGEIVESPFGYHIVQVLDRTEAGTQSLESVSADIKQHLSRMAKDEAFQAFAATLREDADVDYNGK
jgi:parvulin-like peptidyl-prolyl isomerase